jgi:hypothetical protein
MAGLPDGVLWAQPNQDDSSNITGSSIFDFDGDGRVEAVYRDECWARVYDGATGEVIFSAPGANGTGMEYPVIADVDGDFATEIVVPLANNQGSCPSPDPIFAGSGDWQGGSGVVVYRDPQDRWANSRPIWNQHAYSITHVDDRGVVPRSSEIAPNWEVPGLNNFRANTQGGFGVLQLADLTVEISGLENVCGGMAGTFPLEARVCNRGTAPVQDGIVVEFLQTEFPEQTIGEATLACTTATTMLLEPGDCETVSCTASLNGLGNVFVVADPNDQIPDCTPGNNDGASAFQICPG